MGSTLSPALAMALFVAGVFTTVLGVVHVAIPRLLDFDHAIPRDGAGLPPLRTIAFGRWQYTVLRQDVRGVGWVMTNAASYVLVSIGAVDVAWSVGLVRPTAVLAAWIAGWWLIRAAGQFALGRRRGDLAIAAWFGLLGVAHVLAAAA